MIETYYRTDKDLTLLRFFDKVTLREQLAAVEELLERAEEPPFHHILMIDARRSLGYDVDFTDIIHFALRLSRIYRAKPYPLELRVLVAQDWQRIAAEKFALAARMVGKISFETFTDEREMLSHAGYGGHSLDRLFPGESLVRVFGYH